ncbi:hypothetical protein ACHAXR_000043, partial [Thalassiosira sp. AJA248-18]
EEVLTKGGYRLDALVSVNGSKVGIEVDGPTHFVGRKPTGSTILKHRQVTRLEGIPIVSVPYWEWDDLEKDNVKKQRYLRALLGLSSKVGEQQTLAGGLVIKTPKKPMEKLNNAKEEPQYKKLRVPELKNLCRQRQLIIGGLKQQLIDRLEEYDREEATGTTTKST